MIPELKEQALAKMLEEMNKKHSPAEDVIHNWLCDQEDDELFQGILDKKKSIKGALQHCASKAQAHKTGNCAMVDDKTVFSWVRKYFVSSKIKVSQSPVAKVEVASSAPANKKRKKVDNNKSIKAKRKKPIVDGQLDLFEGLL